MRKRLSIYVLVLVLFMSFASCSKKSESTLQTGAGRISKPDVEIVPQSTGEPVPGAEIYVDFGTGDEAMLLGKVDHNGTYHFNNLKTGKYRLVCKLTTETVDSLAKKAELTKAKKLYLNFLVEGIEKSLVIYGSKTGKNRLLYESPEFDIDSRLNALKVSIKTSVNNYGINDDGIK
jgi:hypothetical protein